MQRERQEGKAGRNEGREVDREVERKENITKENGVVE